MSVYGPLAFAITFAETWIASRERHHERISRTYPTMRHSLLSAGWAQLFELILIADILLSVADPKAIIPWVVVGAGIGQFLAVEKTRRKFRKNAGKVENLRKSTKTAKVSVTPDIGGTSAAPAAVSTPKIDT